jgi:transcriptional regulator GlxA family with amidase domain
MRRILFLLHPGFELIDLSGPSAVFQAANAVSGQPLYKILSLSDESGTVPSGCGIPVAAQALGDLPPQDRDTVLVCGADQGPALREPPSEVQRAWLVGAAEVAERYGSICTGALRLARCGLLDGRRATTHWGACAYLRRRYPSVRVEADSLYVTDGRLWTSAGATTGIDMALAMLESDHGAALMAQVARRLVVYAHRPGNQSQFSAVLEAQTAQAGRFAELVAWLEQGLERPLTVETMAARAGMSERGFRRHFSAQTGLSPGRFLDGMRLERAKLLLSRGAPVKQVAAEVGFRSEAAFRKAFQTRFGLTPSLHQAMHAPQV